MRRREAMKVYRGWLDQLPGWTMEVTRGDHVKLSGPHGEVAHLAQTPSDHRSMKNARATIRRLSGRRIT